MACGTENWPLVGYSSQPVNQGQAFPCQPYANSSVVGVVFGHYNGGPPNWTPPNGIGVAFDIDALQPWWFANGSWS
jgi:hypothetical protein